MPRLVGEGRDGWLFLVGGSNDVLSFYRAQDALSEPELDAWAGLLAQRSMRLKRSGIDYAHIVAPEKLSVYSEHIEEASIDVSRAPSSSLRNRIAVGTREAGQLLVDAVEALTIAKTGGHDLYHRTDSHWNATGCTVVYEATCRRFDAPVTLASGRLGEPVRVQMDLGGQVQPPRTEQVQFFHPSSSIHRVHANHLVLYKEWHDLQNEPGLHAGSHVIYRNPRAPDQRRLLIFGDSFAEYRRNMLTGMLSETFHEVHFVWSSQIDWQYVERSKPHVVLTELSERFMRSLPVDDFDTLAFATARLDSFRASRVGSVGEPDSTTDAGGDAVDEDPPGF